MSLFLGCSRAGKAPPCSRAHVHCPPGHGGLCCLQQEGVHTQKGSQTPQANAQARGSRLSTEAVHLSKRRAKSEWPKLKRHLPDCEDWHTYQKTRRDREKGFPVGMNQGGLQAQQHVGLRV